MLTILNGKPLELPCSSVDKTVREQCIYYYMIACDKQCPWYVSTPNFTWGLM